MKIFKKIKSNQSRPTIFEYYEDESSSTVEFRRLAKNIWQQIVSDEITPKKSPSETLSKEGDNEALSPQQVEESPSKRIQEIKSLLVTSSTAGEGKTLLSANLAITIAKSEDKRVLLIDCDMRRPAVHSLFGVKRDVGLSSLLMEETTLEEAIRDTKLENLKIITSGKDTTSPMELLDSKRTKELLDECKSQFDLIICDTPPIVPVHDAEILMPYIDGVLLVVLAGKTLQQVVMRAMEVLNKARANVLGVVLNDTKGILPYYYQPKYYREGYYHED